MAEIVGTLDNDDLSGTSDDDLINGGLGNDTLRGLEGNDTLVGGNETSVGATLGDFYFGGAGEDTVDYSSYSGKVAVVLLDGYPPQGRAEGSTYDSIENLIGTAFDDSLTGDDFDNKIYGGAGQDAINGGAGDDFIVGGPGKEDAFNVYGDQLSGGPGEDTVSYETSGAGVTIFLGLNYSFNHGGDAESDILGSFEIVIGSAFNDTITADNARNTLYGGDGNDALNGETGDDRLYGGDGNDMLDGGAGNDIFGGDTGADSFTGYYGNDTADYSDSGAAVQVDLSNRVGNGGDAAGDTYGSIENVVGSDFDDALAGDSAGNSLYGGDGNDALNGDTGDDSLYGGAGNDMLGGGNDIFGGDAGADSVTGYYGDDTVDYSDSGAAVQVDLSNRVGSGGDATGDTYGSIENVIGSDFDDTLAGDNAHNRLYGGNGSDSLNGDTGDDRLYGGDGNDIFGGDAGADSFTGYYGIDTADYSDSGAAVQVDLSSRVGNGGDAAGDTYGSIENVVGSAFGDTLTADNAANTLTGNAGADIFRFQAVADSSFGYTDQILDFNSGQGDKIDLSAIDADAGTAGDQAFTFIGSGVFTGVAGQLHFDLNFVEGDVNGDAVADFRIGVAQPTLAATDFFL